MDPHDGRVVTNFIRQALEGKSLTVYGDGHQGRSFCYVDDLIRGIVAMGELKENPRTPINLGNPNEFTVVNLARKVRDKLGGHAAINYLPLPTDDPKQRCPDITLAREKLGWEPKVELSEGLDRTIEYLRRVLA